jgi:hypothetical protein
MQFSPISRHFISLQSKHSPQHPVLKHPQLCSSLNVRDQFHTHIEPQDLLLIELSYYHDYINHISCYMWGQYLFFRRFLSG